MIPIHIGSAWASHGHFKMRSDWQVTKQIATSSSQISQMCLQVFGSEKFSQISLLSGGRSHENHLLTLANGQKVVLRIGDDKKNLQKQHTIAHKLWRKLPVPRFLSQVLPAANIGKYFAFLEYRDGQRLANLESLSTTDQAQLGFELGEYLALLHSQKFDHSGEFNSDLKIVDTYKDGSLGMVEFFSKFINAASRHGRISTIDANKYNQSFTTKIQILNEWQHFNCLLHCDLNEDNILHHNGHISAILDWEFVMSGHPALDFGTFTRTPYINCPIFLENLCDSYYLTHKSLPVNWDEIASIVDLMAWAEFLSRKNLATDIQTSAVEKLNKALRG